MNTDRLATKATLLLVSSLTVMAGATIAPALPSIQAHFSDIEYAGLWIRLILTIPALFIVLAAPFTGWFIDRNGRLPLLIPAMILYGIAGSSGLYLGSVGAILAGRALLGIAVAGIMTGATTLIADYYQGKARAQFMGWQAAFMNFGGVVFLTAGGGLAELGWRWPFTIYLLSIILVPLALSALHEPVKRDRKSNPEVTNHDTARPVRLLVSIYGIAFFGMAVFYFIPLQIPFYLNEMVGAGPTASGLAIATVTLFAMVTSLGYGWIRKFMGYISIFGVNFGLMGAGFLIIGLGHSYFSILTGLAISGLGTGLLFPNLNVWLTSEVQADYRGRAVGGLTTSIFLGQFFSPIAGQPVIGAFGTGMLFVSAGALLLILALIFTSLKRLILAYVQPI